MTPVGLVLVLLGTIAGVRRECRDVRRGALSRHVVGPPELAAAAGVVVLLPDLVGLLT